MNAEGAKHLWLVPRRLRKLALPLLLALLPACDQKMSNGARLKPYEQHPFFEDGQSSRPALPGTVPFSEKAPSKLELAEFSSHDVNELPVPLNAALLQRGREQFNIFCAVCHGRDGYGDGIIVRRGFTEPPSFHTDNVRARPLGHYYDVISNGYGAMYSYADRLEPSDRWAVAAYIRALQYSQHAPLDAVPPEALRSLQKEESP